MGETMQCPICCNKYDVLDFTIGENGNPICIYCAQDEEKRIIIENKNN